MPSWAPRPVPTSSAVGVARPSAHGQAMISTATAAVNAAVAAGPAASQPTRVHHGEGDDDRHEDPGDPVGQPLHGGLAVLRLLDQPGHLGELGVGADTGGAHDQAAAGVDGGAGDRVARPDLDRHGLAGEHRGVHGRGARDDDAVGGDLLARAGRRTRRRRVSRSIGIRSLAAVAQHRDVLGAEVEQRAQGGAGPPLGARLEVAAGQQERW